MAWMVSIADERIVVPASYRALLQIFVDGIESLDGKSGREARDVLAPAIEKLGTDEYEDEWADTAGNVGMKLWNIAEMCSHSPEAIVDVVEVNVLTDIIMPAQEVKPGEPLQGGWREDPETRRG